MGIIVLWRVEKKHQKNHFDIMTLCDYVKITLYVKSTIGVLYARETHKQKR